MDGGIVLSLEAVSRHVQRIVAGLDQFDAVGAIDGGKGFANGAGGLPGEAHVGTGNAQA